MNTYFKRCVDYAPGAFLAGMGFAMLASLLAMVIITALLTSAPPLCEQPVNVLKFNNETYMRKP